MGGSIVGPLSFQSTPYGVCLMTLVLTFWLSFLALPAQSAPAPTPQFGPGEGYPQISWKEAPDHMGEQVYVVGRLIHGKLNRGGCLLFFDDPKGPALRIFIRRENLDRFPKPPADVLPGKWVRVRGVIDEFDGRPELSVTSPERIEVISEPPGGTPTSNEATTMPAREFVRVGSFNVLNLFDEFDDAYTSDEGTPAKPRAEMQAVAAAIRKLDADVLTLCEVENRGVLQRFVNTFLADMDYTTVVEIDSNDQRGIDCAVLSRLPVGPVTSYRHVPFELRPGGPKITFRRDLLRVHVEPAGGTPFDVFSVHLKSKRGEKPDSPPIRLAEATKVREICEGLMKSDSSARFVICGDFNDTWDSDPIKILRGEGATALTCFASELPAEKRITYNREPHRSMIDYVFCSPAMAKAYVSGSYRIIEGSVESGGSDHNPIAADFRLR